jgi:acetyl esterase/lipase
MQVIIERDVRYGTGGGRDLHCNIHRPSEQLGKGTAIVFFHGGGFVAGNKDSIDARVGVFAQLGYVCIAAEYRLAGEAQWPAQINDAKACIRWTRANAGALDIDPDRIAVVGFSAGGLLSLIAAGSPDNDDLEGGGGNAGVSSKVAACFAYYPAINLSAQHPLTPAIDYETFRTQSSPHTHVSAAWPPTVLFHGTEDVTIPLESSENFFNELRTAGVHVEFHAIQGVPHAFDRHPELGEACAILGDLFLDRHVITPRTYPPFQSGER